MLEPGDVALARLDVRETLDGIESGTTELERLAAGGIEVLNPPGALVAAHDKLLTARALRLAGAAAPAHVADRRRGSPRRRPSCRSCSSRASAAGAATSSSADTREELEEALARRPQELVPRARRARAGARRRRLGWDLRLVVAGGRVVGAARRVARRRRVADERRARRPASSPVEPPAARAHARDRGRARGPRRPRRRRPAADAQRLRRARGERRRRLPAVVRARRRRRTPTRSSRSCAPPAAAAPLSLSELPPRADATAGRRRATRIAAARGRSRPGAARRPRRRRRPSRACGSCRRCPATSRASARSRAGPPAASGRGKTSDAARAHLVVAPRLLTDAVDVDLERGRHVSRQLNPRALGHVHRMPARVRRKLPVLVARPRRRPRDGRRRCRRKRRLHPASTRIRRTRPGSPAPTT